MDFTDLTFKTFKVCDLEECVELEQNSYSEDEGACRQQIEFRIQNANHLQLGLYTRGELVGMILATSTTLPKLTAQSMKEHQDGKTLCIHSIVVRENWRRKGLATKMLRKYLGMVKRTNGQKFEKCCIIVHDELTKVYASLGFKDMGKSEVQHGIASWIDMQYNFL